MAKKIKKEKIEETYRSGEVLTMFESLKDGIKLVAEQHGGLNDKIDKVSDDLNEFKQETQNNFKTVFIYLSRIDDELQGIKEEIRELKSKLENKADLEKIFSLEKRVKTLEKEFILYRKQALADRS